MDKALILQSHKNKVFLFEDFIDQCVLPRTRNELNTFSDAKAELLRSEGKFPLQRVFW